MTTTINGRTPEEIKKGLECCMGVADCLACPYKKEYSDGSKSCVETSTKDAIAYIQQLERERDAAVRVLEENKRCETCMHYSPVYFCTGCMRGSNWQWRGVQEAEG